MWEIYAPLKNDILKAEDYEEDKVLDNLVQIRHNLQSHILQNHFLTFQQGIMGSVKLVHLIQSFSDVRR